MKTTIDMPDALFQIVEKRATELGLPLNEFLVGLVRHDLMHQRPSELAPSFQQRRRLLPDFARLQESGAFRPKPSDRDITDLISEDRDAR